MKLITILVIALAINQVHTAEWAVIVAGSDGWWNYRHQADTCHAYHIAVKHGIPKSNIIHFAKDDIAGHVNNPIPGKIFNKPDGDDVYAGCEIDYKGADVTPENYLAVLKGEESAKVHKVLKSTAEDTVFLNFSDHGAPGLIAFPNSSLFEPDLIKAFKFMHEKKMYKKMVYYLEACESGSMFVNLPKDLNIYGSSAANETESSWGCYCGPEAHAEGKDLGTCLGDLYSVTWMEDTDKDRKNYTLQDQYKTIVERVGSKSHPKQYGDVTFLTDQVSDWIGPKNASHKATKTYKMKNFVSSRDMKLDYLINKHASEMNENSMNELNEEIMSRKNFDNIFVKVQTLHEGLPFAENTDFDCYKDLINFFENQCGKFSDYGMKYMRSFFDICYHKPEAVVDAKKIVMEYCSAGHLF